MHVRMYVWCMLCVQTSPTPCPQLSGTMPVAPSIFHEYTLRGEI